MQVEGGGGGGAVLDILSAAGQGRIVKRVRFPPREAVQPPGSESLEAWL